MDRFVVSMLLLLSFLGGQPCCAEFPGWQGLRVIEQKGRPSLMRAADLDGDGREELIVVNSRSSRLDIYAWREDSSAIEAEPLDAQRPNELPMAPEVAHQELQLEHVPRDVLVQDLDGDSKPELVVLVSSPNQVIVFRRESVGEEAEFEWKKQYKIDLLEGGIPTRRDVLLIHPVEEGVFQLLVSMGNGIQQLLLQPGGASPVVDAARTAWTDQLVARRPGRRWARRFGRADA